MTPVPTVRFARLTAWERFLNWLLPAHRRRYEQRLNAGIRFALEHPQVSVEFADRVQPWNWGTTKVEKMPAVVALPRYCFSCGTYLMGGATQHKPGCEILRLIESAASLDADPNQER